MPAEADMSTTAIAQDGQSNRQFGDEKLLVKFFSKPKQNQALSDEAGRPIFEDKTYISIMVPGSKTSIVQRPARDKDKQRFSAHYAAFRDHGTEEHITGTPLDAWPALSAAQVMELRHFNIKTVEQLAGLNDNHAQNFMGIRALQQRASIFLEAAQGGAPL